MRHRFPAFFLITAAAAFPAACESDPGASRAPSGGNAAYSPGPFAATHLRIHPLTRLVREGQQEPRIEVHLELADQWGNIVKDLGDLRIEIYRGGVGADPATQLEDAAWTLDLTDPAASSRQFDPVTRTYVVPLADLPQWLVEGRPATLRAQLTTPDGRRLIATRRIAE